VADKSPRDAVTRAVRLEGHVLLARPNFELIESWLKDGLCEPITFSEVVACSGGGNELKDLQGFISSVYGGNLDELSAYERLCRLMTTGITPKFIDQCCYLRGTPSESYLVFLDPGGNIGRWVARLSQGAIEIGRFEFGSELKLTLRSPYDVMRKEAVNASEPRGD